MVTPTVAKEEDDPPERKHKAYLMAGLRLPSPAPLECAPKTGEFSKLNWGTRPIMGPPQKVNPPRFSRHTEEDEYDVHGGILNLDSEVDVFLPSTGKITTL